MLKKIVIIGSSEIVKDHIKVLKKINVQIIGIASSRTKSNRCKKIAREFEIDKTYSNWKDLLKKEDFDGILIASKIEVTSKILQYALKFNKPILVEKPVSLYSSEIKKLIYYKNKSVIVGYNRRYYDTILYLRNYIKKVKEKTIVNISLPEKSNLKYFFANSVHVIDVIHFIFGKVNIIKNKKIFKNKKLIGFITLLENKNGHIINIIGNWGSPDNFSINTYTKNIKLTLCPLEVLSIYKKIEITEPTNSIPIRSYNPKIFKKITLKKNNVYHKPGFYYQALDFLELMKNNKNKKISASLKDALNNIVLCEKIAGKYKTV